MITKTPRLQRGQASNIVLTERDRLIIEAIYQFRFLTTDHIQKLTRSKSRDKLNKRLKQLFDNKYLDRPEVQERMFSHADKRPLVHALGNEGARYIEESFEIKLPSSVYWTDKNKKVKSPDFLLHTLGVADFFVSLQCSLNQIPEGISYFPQRALLSTSPHKTKKLANPLSFSTRFRWWNSLDMVARSTVPDGAFALHDDRGADTKKALLFLEHDGNTMPVVRNTPNQSSIIQKMLGYADIRDRKLHTERFGYKNFRVLFITKDRDQRIASMQKAWSDHAQSEIPAGAFLFTDYHDVIKHSPFGDIWVNAKGERTSLIPDFSL